MSLTLCAGCQDIDDALHARPLPNGNIEAGVRECYRNEAVKFNADMAS